MQNHQYQQHIVNQKGQHGNVSLRPKSRNNPSVSMYQSNVYDERRSQSQCASTKFEDSLDTSENFYDEITDECNNSVSSDRSISHSADSLMTTTDEYVGYWERKKEGAYKASDYSDLYSPSQDKIGHPDLILQK